MKKTILITGSTDGIGKLAAEKLAKAGHELYLHGRKPEKLAACVRELRAATGNNDIEGFVADLSDLGKVSELAAEVLAKLEKLDVLINNAGVFHSPRQLNDAGIDMRYAVNYLAPFQLTNDLLPLIKKGSKARIINLSSAAQTSVDLDVLMGKKRDSVQATYAQSKLALTMWSYGLANELAHVTVVPVNPGSLLNTNMVKEAYGQHWGPASKGADILVDLSVGNQYEGITGKYFDNDHGTFGRPHADVFDKAKIEVLIAKTCELLGR